MYCRLNSNGMTINPDGNISVCCSNNGNWDIGHISEIDDLNKHWKNHPDMIKLRNDDPQKMMEACGSCLRKTETFQTRWHLVNEEPRYLKIRNDNEIRYLEFTTSNICNQTCASCSSYFSSKWRHLEEELIDLGFLQNAKSKNDIGFNSYNHPISRIEDKDISKIMKLLPQLDKIDIKGGEPFADKNNFFILDELLKTNPNCVISISTNFSSVPQKHIDLFKKSSAKPTINVSMDGVYEVYEYIRSTPFQKTVDNIKYWYKETGHQVNVQTFYSMYNMLNLKEVLEFFSNNLREEVKFVVFHKWINSPFYISPQRVLFQRELDELKEIVMSPNITKYFSESEGKFVNRNLYNFTKIGNYESTIKWRKEFVQYTKWLNLTRGIDIYEHIPLLKGIK